MNHSTLNKRIEFASDEIMSEVGVIFQNLDTGQTYLIQDKENKTVVIDLHPSEWLELEAAQKKENDYWEELGRNQKKFIK